MRKLTFAFFFGLALMGGSQCAWGQYHWKVTHVASNPPDIYLFGGLSSYGDVCTASCIIEDTTAYTFQVMFYRSTDAGLTWVEQNPHLPILPGVNNLRYSVQQIDYLNAVAVSNSGYIIRTFDGGNTWVQQNHGNANSFTSVNFSDSMTGIVVGWSSNSVFTTTNGGLIWDSINIPLQDTGFSLYVGHSYGNNTFIAISYGAGPIYRTDNDWQTDDSSWISEVPIPFVIDGCNFRGADTMIAYGENESPGGLYLTYSTDAGRSWNLIHAPDGIHRDTVFNPSCMSSLDETPVFLAGYSNGNYLDISTDHGMTWRADSVNFDTLLPFFYCNGVTVTPEGHAIGAFRVGSGCVLARGDIVPANVKQALPNNTKMELFPNPASSSITITSAEAGSIVHLLDILGREVMQGTVPANGPLTLDVGSLRAGMYYISDGQTRAKFMKE